MERPPTPQPEKKNGQIEEQPAASPEQVHDSAEDFSEDIQRSEQDERAIAEKMESLKKEAEEQKKREEAAKEEDKKEISKEAKPSADSAPSFFSKAFAPIRGFVGLLFSWMWGGLKESISSVKSGSGKTSVKKASGGGHGGGGHH